MLKHIVKQSKKTKQLKQQGNKKTTTAEKEHQGEALKNARGGEREKSLESRAKKSVKKL